MYNVAAEQQLQPVAQHAPSSPSVPHGKSTGLTTPQLTAGRLRHDGQVGWDKLGWGYHVLHASGGGGSCMMWWQTPQRHAHCSCRVRFGRTRLPHNAWHSTAPTATTHIIHEASAVSAIRQHGDAPKAVLAPLLAAVWRQMDNRRRAVLPRGKLCRQSPAACRDAPAGRAPATPVTHPLP